MNPGHRAAAAVLAAAAASAAAQDAQRGAGLYLQLPGVASCVSCHGPDLLANRNGFLRAADNPQALQKALNAVGVMGYLKPVLGESDVADLAAFLGRVAPLAAGDAPLQAWPLVAEFGGVGFGDVAGPQVIRLRNRGVEPLVLQPPMSGSDGLLVAAHDCPATLAPGGGCAITLRLQGTSLGAAAGALAIGSAATANPLLVAWSADVRDAAGARLQWDGVPAQVDFDGGGVRMLALVNAGSMAATLGTTTVIGPAAGRFAASGCAPGTRLEPSARCELTLRHEAATGGDAAEAVLQVRADGMHPPSVALRAAAPSVVATLPDSAGSGGGGAFGIGAVAALALAATALRRRRSS